MVADRIKAGAIAGIAASILFILFFIGAIFLYPGYSLQARYMSDLGAYQGSSLFFNSGVILAGILGIIFGYGIISFFKKKGIWGARLFIVSAIALIGVGVFTEDNLMMHNTFSGLFFVIGAISIALIATEYGRNVIYFSAVIALLSLAFAGLRVQLLEHLAVFGIVLWVFVVSVGIIRGRKY